MKNKSVRAIISGNKHLLQANEQIYLGNRINYGTNTRKTYYKKHYDEQSDCGCGKKVKRVSKEKKKE